MNLSSLHTPTLLHVVAAPTLVLALLSAHPALAQDAMDQARALLQPKPAFGTGPIDTAPNLDAHLQAERLIRAQLSPPILTQATVAAAGIVDAHQQARDLLQPMAAVRSGAAPAPAMAVRTHASLGVVSAPGTLP